jgi:cell division ATPase FtsA
MVNKEMYETIRISMAGARFKNELTTQSIINNIGQILKTYNKQYVVNIHIEKEAILTTIVENKKIHDVKKFNFGINHVIGLIARKMNITNEKALFLYKNYGNIPPEAIIDNKVIAITEDAAKRKQTFTKRELSEYITAFVDAMLNTIYNTIRNYIDINSKVIFSGDVVTLNGFKTYTSKTLSLVDSEIYESNIFGFHTVNTLNITGAIELYKETVEKNKTKKLELSEQEIRNRFLNKINKLRGRK